MARNETRLSRWARWVLVATLAVVVVQVVARLVLDPAATWIVGTAAWWCLIAGTVLTVPVKVRGPRRSTPSWKTLAPAAPALGASLLVPPWPDSWPDIGLLWFGIGAFAFLAVFAVVIWYRLRRARTSPDRLVDVRAQPPSGQSDPSPSVN